MQSPNNAFQKRKLFVRERFRTASKLVMMSEARWICKLSAEKKNSAQLSVDRERELGIKTSRCGKPSTSKRSQSELWPQAPTTAAKRSRPPAPISKNLSRKPCAAYFHSSPPCDASLKHATPHALNEHSTCHASSFNLGGTSRSVLEDGF
jgi:hypothetical protein